MKVNKSLTDMLSELKEEKKAISVVENFGPFGKIAIVRSIKVSRDSNRKSIDRFYSMINKVIDVIKTCEQDLLISEPENKCDYVLYGGNCILTLLSELTYNKIAHGNRFNPDLPVTIEAYIGKCKGIVISISDSGEGFNIEEIISKMQRENQGRGMHVLQALEKEIEWSYDNNGAQVNIMLLYKPETKQKTI